MKKVLILWLFWKSFRIRQNFSLQNLIWTPEVSKPAALGNEISEYLQNVWRLLWQSPFLPSPNPFQWHAIWRRVILRILKSIYIHLRSMSNTKIVRVVIFCAVHFSSLSDTYTVYIQYTRLPKEYHN